VDIAPGTTSRRKSWVAPDFPPKSVRSRAPNSHGLQSVLPIPSYRP